jgi:uncharacterized membrane protein
MATYQLRPMSAGEILDASFAILRHHFRVLFAVALVCEGLPQALGLYVQFGGGMLERPGLAVVALILRLVGYLLMTGATIRVVSEAYLGREPQLSEALDYAVSKMGRTLTAGIAQSILILLSSLLLIIPGIIVACGLSVAVQAAVLEPLNSGTDAVGRSWSLTKGFKGRALVLWAVVVALSVLLVIGIAVVTAVATLISQVLIVPALVLWALVSLLVYPFTSCVFTLFYYDLRVRKEAFDLELLSEHLGIESASG